jgi:formylglycine-generating enzyme
MTDGSGRIVRGLAIYATASFGCNAIAGIDRLDYNEPTDASPSGSAGSPGGATAAGGASGTPGAGGVPGGSPGAGGAGLVGGDGGAAGNASGAGGVGASAGGSAKCPAVPGLSPMITVPAGAGASYCVDATEVTQEQYRAFLTRAPEPGAQVGPCAANPSFEPAAPCALDLTSRRPVACVDWCDARAFCQSFGKRLCGAIDGGLLSSADTADASKSQWYNACSQGGARLFAFGDAYTTLTWDFCNGLESSSTQTVAVATKLMCEGGYPGLFDMSGNVREWEDACDDAGNCASRGGGYLDSGDASAGKAESLRCASAGLVPRLETNKERGFRCCADLK